MRAFCAGAHALLTCTNRTTSASHASVLVTLLAQCNFELRGVWVPSDDEPSGSDEDEQHMWSRVLGLCFHVDFRERGSKIAWQKLSWGGWHWRAILLLTICVLQVLSQANKLGLAALILEEQ